MVQSATDSILEAIEDAAEERSVRAQVTSAAVDCAKSVLRHVPRQDDRAARAIAMVKAFQHEFVTLGDVDRAAEEVFNASVEYMVRRDYEASEACLAAYCAALTLVDPNRLNGVAMATAEAMGFAAGSLGARQEDIEEVEAILASHIPDIAAYEAES